MEKERGIERRERGTYEDGRRDSNLKVFFIPRSVLIRLEGREVLVILKSLDTENMSYFSIDCPNNIPKHCEYIKNQS